MSGNEHLSLSQVRAYVRGALHPSTLVGIDDHLETCAACRAALARESDASFGAEAFALALAAPEVRPETPHLSFDHLRGAVDGTLTVIDREWVEAHVTLCAMCAEELRDLERFAATVPGRPAPAKPAPWPPAAVHDAPHPVDEGPAPRKSPSRVRQRAGSPNEPPSRYGQQAPARLPWWIKAIAGVSLLALVQSWAC